MAKPTRKPTWATDADPLNNIEPDTALQLSGVPLGGKIGRQHYNYLFGSTSEWVDWVQSDAMDRTLNLNDLTDKAQARINLGASNASNLLSGTVNNDRLTKASTSIQGITQLNNTTTSTSTTEAATASAVKAAYDRAAPSGHIHTATQVGAATAGLSVGSVGSYAFLQRVPQTDTATPPGATVAGSTLLYANRGFAESGGIFGYVSQSPTGTWRCMGADYYTDGSSTNNDKYTGTLWLRIA